MPTLRKCSAAFSRLCALVVVMLMVVQAQHAQALQKELEKLSAEVAAQRMALIAAASERDVARASAIETSERLQVSRSFILGAISYQETLRCCFTYFLSSLALLPVFHAPSTDLDDSNSHHPLASGAPPCPSEPAILTHGMHTALTCAQFTQEQASPGVRHGQSHGLRKHAM